MLSRGENLFPLTLEQKMEHSHGFPSLPGCEALIDLSVAQLEVAVSFTSCPKLLLCVPPGDPRCGLLGPQCKKQGHSEGKLLQLELV